MSNTKPLHTPFNFKIKLAHYCAIICIAFLASVTSSLALAASNSEAVAAPQKPAANDFLPISTFTALTGNDEKKALAAITRIEQNWHEAYAAMLIESIYQVPSRQVLARLILLMEKVTGLPFDGDTDAWYVWLWSKERAVHPDYADFKVALLSPIDARFKEYFEGHPKTLIRLDEIRWGGVRRDGIPPLKNPKMISAKDATWLQDDNVVFGVAINGDVRAYPKRILAWH